MPYFNLDRDARLVAPTIDESAYDPDAADTPRRFNSWPSDRLQPDPPVERSTDNSDYYHGYDLKPSRSNGEVRVIPTESKTEAVRRAQRARHDNGFYYEYRDDDGSVGYVDDNGFVLEKDD